MKQAGPADTAGFVLAGGRSSRMGVDKALLSFAGEPLAACAVRLLRQAGLAAAIAGARANLAGLAPVIEDPVPDQGPLAGICAALASTAASRALFLPVDLPLLPVALLDYLLLRARIANCAVLLASVSGFPQTFPAVVRRDLAPSLQDELAGGCRGCFAAFRAAAARVGEAVSVVAVELLAQPAQVAHPAGIPVFEWFLNVNSPEDLRRAEALAARPLALEG